MTREQDLKVEKVWLEGSKKWKRFKVSICPGIHDIEEVMFIVTNESEDKVELIYSLEKGDRVSFNFPKLSGYLVYFCKLRCTHFQMIG